jgi:CHASE2 domain-containing sensor protein
VTRRDVHLLAAAYLAERAYTRVARPRILVTVSAALVAGVATVLGLAAAADAWLDSATPVLIALAAVWIPQTIIVANRYTRRRSRRVAGQ